MFAEELISTKIINYALVYTSHPIIKKGVAVVSMAQQQLLVAAMVSLLLLALVCESVFGWPPPTPIPTSKNPTPTGSLFASDALEPLLPSETMMIIQPTATPVPTLSTYSVILSYLRLL